MASPIRLSGISSGLDTQSIVGDLMKIEQLKVDRATRNKTSLEWKRDAYSAVNTQLKDFREKYFSVLNSNTNMLSAKTYQVYKTNMTSNNAINLTPTSSTFSSKLVLSSVTMAKGATIQSDLSGQSRRAALSASDHVLAAKSVGEVTTISSDDLALYMSDESFVDESGNNLFGYSSTTDTISFSINGKAFSFDRDDTLSDAMLAVNNSDAGVTMSFDNGKFALQSKNTGSSASVVLANTTGRAFGTDSGFGIAAGIVKAETAVITGSSTLSELANTSGKTVSATMEFNINGQAFSFTSSQTIDEVIADVNNSGAANVTMRFDEKLGTFALRSDTFGTGTSLTVSNTAGNFFGDDSLTNIKAGSSTAYAAIKRTDTLDTMAYKIGKSLTTNADGKFEFAVNGKTFTLDTTSTVQALTDAVNCADLGVTLNYSEISDALIFKSKTAGEQSTAVIQGFESLGISTLNAAGNDAQIVLENGEQIIQATNSFTLDGIAFEIKGDYAAATPITAEFTQDVDSVVTKFKQFITDYNTLLDSLNEKLSEKKYTDFYPLTTTEKDAMSEKEIENWEKKAKSGLQHSDAALTGMISSLRSALYDTVQGTGLKPSDLGLKSSTWSTSGELQKGQLVFDQAAEIKLRAALQKDPDAVAKVMGTISNATNAETKYKESGFFARINDKMNQYINSTRKGTIKNTETAIISASEKISDMTDLMATKETQYFSQFTRMEKLMSSLNAQSSWFTAQMGG